MANDLEIDKANPVAGLGTFSYTFSGVDGIAEVTTITAVADVAGSLNSTFFNLNAALDTPQYYVWYNINGLGVDPAVVGKTGVMVAAATGATANAIALATRTALALLPLSFSISGATNQIIVTNVNTGATTNASNGTASPGFSYLVNTAGVTASPTDLFLTVDVQSTIPRDPGSQLFSSQVSPQDSALLIEIKKNGVTQNSAGGITTNPTPSQPSIGCRSRLSCEGGDVISVVLSSANAVDGLPNRVKSTINMFLGA